MPTRETLERELKKLKAENARLRKAVEKLNESEEKFKTIVENANDEIIYVGMDGTIIEINDKCEELFGFKREEVIGRKLYEFGYFSPEEMQKQFEGFRKVYSGKIKPEMKEVKSRHRDGSIVHIEVNPKVIEKNGETLGILTIIRDITERKKSEAELEKYRNHLEDLVRERTQNLEEANTALRVMLEKAHEVKKEIEDKISFNVKKFVFPYLKKLKKSRLGAMQSTCLDHLEKNLSDITSPYMHDISTKYVKLTPTEIEVANLVKQGKTTKDIADHLNISVRTVDAHRYSIRTKIGLSNKKKNLRTYLLSFK